MVAVLDAGPRSGWRSASWSAAWPRVRWQV